MNQFYQRFFTTIIFLYLCAGIKAQEPQERPDSKIVSIDAKDTPLIDVFKSIRKQTGLHFSYNNSEVDQEELITITLVNTTVDKALRNILAGKMLSWIYISNKIIRIGRGALPIEPDIIPENPASAETKPQLVVTNISGQVTDKKGNPLASATVSLKGWKQTRITTSKGAFSFLNIPPNSTLIITSIGYRSTEFNIAGQTNVQITLDSLISEIQVVDVVSTGYEEVLKERATGSFVKIDHTKFHQVVATDFPSRLPLMASGVSTISPGIKPSVTRLLIRGMSTLGGPSDPLIVLDNFPYNGNLNNINPNDIENITILKDAAAASIWGTKAGNGVIVITTKKGEFNKGVRVRLNSSITIGEKPDLFSDKSMAPSDFVEVEKFLFSRGFYNEKLDLPKRYSLTQAVNILDREKRGEISRTEANIQLEKLRNTDVRKEYSKLLYKNEFNQQHAINITGGTSNNAWFLSGGFDDNSSNLGASAERYTFHFNNVYKVNRYLEVDNNIFYTVSDSKSGALPYKSFRPSQLPIYSLLTDESGNASPAYSFGNYREGYIDTVGAGKLLDWKYYPLDDYKHSIDKTRLKQLNAELGARYRFRNGLSISVKYRYRDEGVNRNFYQDKYSYYTRDLVNKFTQLNRANGVVKYIVPYAGIKDNFQNSQVEHDARVMANFEKTINRHNFVLLAGAQINSLVTEANSSRIYGFDADSYTSQVVDLINYYPHFITEKQEKIPNTAILEKAIVRNVGAFFNGSYTINDRYSFSISARRDGNNTFGINVNNRWKPLWSSGVSWLIADEPFYNISFLPYLKLRATYGKSGNTDVQRTGINTIRYQGTNAELNLPFARFVNTSDPELRWEEVKMLNLGINFSTQKDRISGNIEFFHKLASDLYGLADIDMTTGIGRNTVAMNAGELKGSGLDIDLHSTNIKGRFSWSTNLMFSFYSEKITKFRDNEKLKSYEVTGGSANGLVGYPVFSLLTHRYGGLEAISGDPLGYLNGKITRNYAGILSDSTKVSDLLFMGSLLPKISGSLANTFSFHNILFTVLITFKLGHYFQRESINYGALYNEGISHSDFYKRWKKAGDERYTSVPGMNYPADDLRDKFYEQSSVLATKADNIRLKFINISYMLNKSRMRRLPFRDMEVYMIINDPGIIWKANKEGLDPENPGIRAARSVSIGTKISL